MNQSIIKQALFFFGINILFYFQSDAQNTDRYPFLSGEKYGLCDFEGNITTQPIYDEIEESNVWKNHFEAVENGIRHIIDSKGNVIFSSPTKYISLQPLYDDRYPHPDNLGRKIDFRLENNNLTAIFTYPNGVLKTKTFLNFDDYKRFNDIGRYTMNEIPSSNDAIPVAIDSNNMNFVNNNLDYIFKESFFDGFAISNKLFAIAKTKGKYQLYNRAGQLLSVDPFVDAIPTDRADYAIIVRNNNDMKISYLINNQGKELNLDITNFKSFSKNVLFGYSENLEKYKLYTYGGKDLGINLTDVSEWKNKLNICKNENSKYGLMDENAHWILPAEFDQLNYISNNNYSFVKGDSCGIIESDGNIKSKAQGNNIYHEIGAIYKIRQNGKYGYIDTLGNILLETKYNELDVYMNKNKILYIAKKGEKWGVIDSSQNIIMDFLFENIDLYNMEVTKDKAIYKIDSLGEIKHRLYKHPKDFKFDNKSSSLVDLDGKPISSEKYSFCKIINESSEKDFFYVMQNKNVNSYSINEVYNYNGKQIIPEGFYYRESDIERLGLLYIISRTENTERNSNLALINSNGEFVYGPSIFPCYLIGKKMFAQYNNIDNSKTIYTADGKIHSKQYPYLDHVFNRPLTRFGILKPATKKIKNDKFEEKPIFIDLNYCKPNYLYGYLDENGYEVVPPKFERLSIFKNFGIGIRTNNNSVTSEIFDKSGKLISKFTNSEIFNVDALPSENKEQSNNFENFNLYNLIFTRSKKESNSERLFGIINLLGEVKLKPVYKNIIFDTNFWHCEKDGKFEVYDRNLNHILDYSGEKASFWSLPDENFYIGTDSVKYILNTKTKKKIIIKDSPMFINNKHKNTLFVGNINKPYLVNLTNGVIYKN